MLVPYQISGRDVFHLKLEQFNNFGIWEWEVKSTLPHELLRSSYPAIWRKRKIGVDVMTVSKAYFLLKKLSKSIIDNPISKYFYYNEYLLELGKKAPEHDTERLLTHLAGYELVEGLYASTCFNPLLLWSTQELLYCGYFFYPKEYQACITQIDYQEFQMSFPGKIDRLDVTFLSFWKYDNKELQLLYSTRNHLKLEHLIVTRT